MAFTFDGVTKTIILSLGTVSFSTVDLYSSWKVWWMTGDNAKYLPAFKVVGGDPTSGGNSITPYFFLDNGWKVRPQEASHTLDIEGILITVDNSDPFTNTIGNWRIVIKNVVPIYAENTSAVINGDIAIDTTQIASDIWTYNNRSLTNKDVNITSVNGTPTTSVNDFKANLSTIPAAVWSYVSRELTVNAGLTPSQETTLNNILSKLGTTLDANIKSVQGVAVTSVDDFKADIVTIDPSDIWSYPTRELTVASGMTPAQEAKIDAIKSRTDKLTFDSTNHLLSYIDDKTGYSLTTEDKTSIANIVEQEIINEADAEKVLTAITDKIASVNPDLGDITTGSIASAVWSYVNRGLTVASGLTIEQNQLLEEIASNSAVTRKSITNKVSIFPQADGDIIVVYDEDGVTPVFRTHVSTDKTQRIKLVG